ncbi:MAG: head-tail connector protein [Hyphomicrobiaceae bacterium]
MSLVMTSGPALEPVSLAEAKAHLRIDGTAEDALIQSLIVTSRLHIEAALGLALITQNWSYYLDRWPKSGRLVLPLRPVAALAHVRVWSDEDVAETLDLSDFLLDGEGMPPRLVALANLDQIARRRMANSIEVGITAGFGASSDDVPATIRHALLLLVAHWYEHREPVQIGVGVNAVPAMVSELLAPYRRRRL